MYSGCRSPWWPSGWLKEKRKRAGGPQRARAAANLLWPHCAAVRLERQMRRRCEQRLLLHLKLRTASLLRAAQKRNVRYRSWMGWNCDPAVRGKQILIYLRSFPFLFFFFSSFELLRLDFTACVFRRRLSLVMTCGVLLALSVKKKKEKGGEKLSGIPKKPQSLSEGAFYAQLLSVQWTMPLKPGQYGG